MPALTSIVMFTASALMLALAPGPDNLFVLAQSARYGARSGLIITAGLCSGLVVHTLLVAFGVAALISASPLAFSIVQGLGAAYLLYLAYKTFHDEQKQDTVTDTPELSGAELYSRGVIMNLTNPKVLMFFMSLLPQFADPARGAVAPQIVVFGALFMIAAATVFSAVSLTAGTAGRLLQGARGKTVLNYVAGFVFLGLGALMLFEIAGHWLR